MKTWKFRKYLSQLKKKGRILKINGFLCVPPFLSLTLSLSLSLFLSGFQWASLSSIRRCSLAVNSSSKRRSSSGQPSGPSHQPTATSASSRKLSGNKTGVSGLPSFFTLSSPNTLPSLSLSLSLSFLLVVKFLSQSHFSFLSHFCGLTKVFRSFQVLLIVWNTTLEVKRNPRRFRQFFTVYLTARSGDLRSEPCVESRAVSVVIVHGSCLGVSTWTEDSKHAGRRWGQNV